MAPNRNKWQLGLVFILFGIPWSVITLAFDGVLLIGMVRQGMSLTYDVTQGTITQSDVKRVERSRSIGYSLELRYTYRVNNVEYSSTKYKYGAESRLRHSVENLARKLPVGRRVPVCYSPSTPGNSVLFRGVDGGDLLFPLFLTPFNIIMLWIWYSVRNSFRRRINPNWLKRRTRSRDGQTRIRLSQYPFTEVFATVLLMSSFVCTFVVALSGLSDYLWFTLSICCCVVGISAFVANRCDSANKNLVLDDDTSAITLSADYGRTDRLDLPRNQLVGLRIVTETIDHDEGPNREKWNVLIDHRSIKDTSRSEATLFTTVESEEAAILATWLGQRLSLEVTVAESQLEASS